ELDTFVWRMDSCTFCNTCVIVCPFSALKMTGNFESAVYDRRLLAYNLAKYAGPPANVLLKTVDLNERKKLIEQRDVFSGETYFKSLIKPVINPVINPVTNPVINKDQSEKDKPC
ncbi:MAG: 4Fe-4S binding protein, partial [Bdellovibrionota bacterium]